MRWSEALPETASRNNQYRNIFLRKTVAMATFCHPNRKTSRCSCSPAPEYQFLNLSATALIVSVITFDATDHSCLAIAHPNPMIMKEYTRMNLNS
tara:strand:- start:189 stop:473 length:285 start_codon:yes stop_codon:yes gene_type:complete